VGLGLGLGDGTGPGVGAGAGGAGVGDGLGTAAGDGLGAGVGLVAGCPGLFEARGLLAPPQPAVKRETEITVERMRILKLNLGVKPIETSKTKLEVTGASTLLASGPHLFTARKARNLLRVV
jgi:hypothetical protein